MSRLRRLSSLLFASIIALGSLTLSANALATTVRLEIEDWDAFFKARSTAMILLPTTSIFP